MEAGRIEAAGNVFFADFLSFFPFCANFYIKKQRFVYRTNLCFFYEIRLRRANTLPLTGARRLLLLPEYGPRQAREREQDA